MRGIPDVAADGDPVTGIAVITSNAGGGYTISGHAGTSASAPLWAAIIALADQYAQCHLGFVNPAIYQIARSSQYHQAFHDVTAANSNTAEFPPTTITGYRAGPGWDPVTGWGSPAPRFSSRCSPGTPPHDSPETFTETVATERGALISAGLGGQDQTFRLGGPGQTLNSSGWSRRASDSAISRSPSTWVLRSWTRSRWVFSPMNLATPGGGSSGSVPAGWEQTRHSHCGGGVAVQMNGTRV
jgi:subtilase family serine protease